MILVAGAGFVGAELVRLLRQQGQPVTALTLSGGADSEACDLTDPAALSQLADRIGPAAKIVLSASSGRGGAERYREVFVDGARRLLETFAPDRLIFTSSTSVYAQTNGEEIDETSEALPSRETSQILLQAESHVRAAGGVVARLSGIYGSGRSVILRRYLQGLAKIDGDPANPDTPGRHLNQIHRDDAASALAHLLDLEQAAGEVYNVSDDQPLSQRDCYTGLDKLFGKGIPDIHAPDQGRKRGWSDKRILNAKLRATGWQPTHASYLDAVKADPELVPSIEEQIRSQA